MGKDLGGSGCGIIKVRSWHLSEWTEVNHETCRDRQCSDPDMTQTS
jgi:hypothetical protein